MKEYKFAHLTLEVEDTMRMAISEEDFATVLHKTENNEGVTLSLFMEDGAVKFGDTAFYLFTISFMAGDRMVIKAKSEL
ncbi:hypothetical protein D0504_04480 [Weissella confusa]|uniref:hypothetical protein n=1 Tax=Weissella confusa TaxID=1583 RepID=UPI0021C16C52|nr:hypothetical protein [Weissella confusa]MCT8392994.1 hypothetical protein [Weissella confusa]